MQFLRARTQSSDIFWKIPCLPPPPPYTMLKIRENSGWAPPTLFVALFREIGLGMRDFKNVHILKWRLNKTFRGIVKWRMWVDVASKGSNDIFRLFHSLMEKDYPAWYIQWNLSLGHLHSEDKIWYRNNVRKLLKGHLYLGVEKGHFFWVSKPGFNSHSGNT